MDDPAAASERATAFLDRLARLDTAVLEQTALATPDAEVVGRARAEAERLATERGLGPVLSDARRTARETVLRRYADAGYRPTMVGLNWGVSEGTTRDRVAIVEAVDDAVTAAVVASFAPAEVTGPLEDRFDLLERSAGMDASFDLGRATAAAIAPGRPGRRSIRTLVGLAIVAIVAITLVAGLWGSGAP